MKILTKSIVTAMIMGSIALGPTASVTTAYTNTEENKKEENIVTYVTSAQQLEDIISNNTKVALDIGATSCLPCQKYAPIFEETAKEYKQVKFARVETNKISPEERKAIVSKYNVKMIPLTILIKDKEEKYRTDVFIKKDKLSGLIQKHLLN